MLCLLALTGAVGADELDREFAAPPPEARPWCYWWWLNGAASTEGITRDMEEMRAKGIGGALLFDAGDAGGPEAPRGPPFMSPEWRELFKHAVREADRCGIVLTVNLCSGWNAGGPWVTEEHAAKRLVSAEARVQGGQRVTVSLPTPSHTGGYYRDVAVLAAPVPEDGGSGYTLVASSHFRDFDAARATDEDEETRWISNGDRAGMGPTPEKPEFLQFDFPEARALAAIHVKPYPDCGPREVEVQGSDDGTTFRPLKRETFKPGEEKTIRFEETRAKHFRVVFLSAHPFRGGASWNVQIAELAPLAKNQEAPPFRRWSGRDAVDVTPFMDQDGKLEWMAPAGRWRIVRIGATLHGARIKCLGSGPSGLEIDTMSAEAMEAHFAETGAKLIADAGPRAGKTLQYLHIDSWELGQPTWTPRMREEFQRRRGYDPLPWLPAVLGQTVNTAEETARFLHDYRRTAADLVAENYYGRLEELSVKGGLRGTHPESGGPFFTHWIDALQCMGRTAIPMGEFWRRAYEPDGPLGHAQNPSVKQAASAAHIYAKPLCQAEAFTSMQACDWTAEPWIFKDIGDAAFCEGLTRNVLCFWVHQPKPAAKPGFQWPHVGTHFDHNITWWPLAEGWLTYLSRCQHLLRQGLFVADFAYLQSEAIPGFLQKRHEQQPARPAGFDYDVLNAEALLSRVNTKGGRLMLPDGMSYRYLVLPHEPNAILSPATLKKVGELAVAGVTVVGPASRSAAVPTLRVGALADVVKTDGLAPDLEMRASAPGARFDWIHRRAGGTNLYFISNQSREEAAATAVFRVAGQVPELWDAVTGKIRTLDEFTRTSDGRTEVPLVFAPRQSFFIVFRRDAPARGPAGTTPTGNFTELKPVMELPGPWDVAFDPAWFYPAGNPTGTATVRFEKLEDWTLRSEAAIKHYSGLAAYRKTFDLASPRGPGPVFLDLGAVKNVARVRLNGRDLGTVWTAPWRVEITGAVKEKDNALEIEVANLWPNRLIGDATLPMDQRRTVTNVRTYDTLETPFYGCPKCSPRKKDGRPAELLPSGLLGPVRILVKPEAGF